MRKLSIALLFLFISTCISGCNNQPQDNRKEMMVLGRPTITEYFVGERLSLEGLKVIDVDTGERLSDYATDPIEGYEFVTSDLGTKTVSVSKNDYKDTSFTIKVKENPYVGAELVEIYATNDIHGQIEEARGRASLTKMMTYLKNKKDNNPNVLLLDQGDTWQGSIYSNFNHGALITDVMNYVQYDARTVGNHDFDWGLEPLLANTAREYEGYKTPVLAANVYDYNFDTKKVGTNQQSDIGIKSISYTLENGLKVGIVGTIGQNQITSINSLFTHDIAFINHINVIKSESAKLREEGCDIVIASCHAGQEDLLGNSLANYVDLVLCAHTHKNESIKENGILFAQFGCYSQYVGHIKLYYDKTLKKVTTTDMEFITSDDISKASLEDDPTILSIVNTYNSECSKEAEVIVASNVSGQFSRYDQLPNLMCKAIYDASISEGYDVDLTYCNEARANLYGGLWEYANLYNAFPFDNVVYIIEVTYAEMMREIKNYNYIYRSPKFDGVLVPGSTYKIAAIDFLVFHTNVNRYYDFFNDNGGNSLGHLQNNYRVILKNYLIDNGYNDGKILYNENYSSNLDSYSRNSLTH